MTDSNHDPSTSSTSNSHGYEGTDPDRPDKKAGPRSGISTVQVGASAAAAVTSALAASFFGVAGTLIGAAVGSIVSTIAGALYVDYLGRAGARVKATTDVVIQRIPADVLATSPLRHLTSPTDLPGEDSLSAVGDEAGDEHVTVPVEGATELIRRPDGKAELNPTSVLPAVPASAASTARPASAPLPPHLSPRSPAPPAPAEVARPWWKRPVPATLAVSGAGFLIAIGAVVGAEAVIGHPVSGGSSGTTLSRVVSNDTSSTGVTPTESPTPTATATPTSKATTTPTATATEVAPVVPTTAPAASATATSAATATAAPTAQSTGAADGVAPVGTEAP